MRYLPTCTQGAGNQPMLAFRLALVTVFQFMENLTDRQAADAVRSRLDWKYALVRRVVHSDIPGAARKNYMLPRKVCGDVIP
jgi:hypothetical protein